MRETVRGAYDRRTVLTAALGCTAGCVGGGDSEDGDSNGDGPADDESNQSDAEGNRDEWQDLKISAYVFTERAAVDAVDAVSAEDERFADVELWQQLFEQVRTSVREGSAGLDDPGFTEGHVWAPLDSERATAAESVYDSIPLSGPLEEYEDGRYVELTVDGEVVVARVVRGYARED